MNNNNFNEFNEGGTHESSPTNGIPQGPNATVEQGETSTKTPNGKYIYSNRLYINEDLVKQFNLPNSIKGKTFADASKIIDKPFKDKNSNPDKLTHKEHLDRLKQAQETLKAEEQQKQEAFLKNMQQMPDVSQNPIPQGMEEYTELQDNSQEEAQELPQMSAYGGFIKKTYGFGGDLLNTGLTMGANTLLPGSGALVQPLVSSIEGLFNKDDGSVLRNNAINTNSQFSDKFAKGGYITKKPSKYAIGGNLNLGDPINKNIKDIISDTYSAYSRPDLIPSTNNGIEIPDLSEKNGYSNPELAPNNNKSFNVGDTLNKVGNYLDKNGGKFLKYSPVAMNAYQLSQLKKPTGVVLDKLSNRYNPTYMDEASLTNIANNETNNTIAGLTNATAGSESALRANLVGANVGRIKGLSDSYAKMREYNAGQNAASQQFNLGVDQANINQSNAQLDINDRNQANYRNQKSKLLGAIGTDLGEIGKEEINKNAIAKALGYDTYGNYVVNKQTGEKMLATDFHKKVENGTLGKKYNFNSNNNFKPISYSPNMNFNKLGR